MKASNIKLTKVKHNSLHLFLLININILPRFFINCADNSWAKTLKIFASKNIQATLNRLPPASVGDMVLVSCKKGKPDLRKKYYMPVL